MEKKTYTMSMQQHIQSLIDDMEDIVNNHPYHAFALLAIVIEVLGKCFNKSDDWYERGNSGNDFCSAINLLYGLEKYRKYSEDKEYNRLYDVLRNGMLHTFLPKESITLSPNESDLSNNIIGCKELYQDIKNAWKEINEGSIHISKDLSKPVINITDENSGLTPDITYK